MVFDPETVEDRAKQREDDNWRFRSYLKWQDEMDEPELDALVCRTADEAARSVDCAACARCCTKLQIQVSETDQRRLAQALGMNLPDLQEKYLVYGPDDEGGSVWRMKEAPCPFLENGRCSVYEARPEQCRDYPYLHKPDFTSRLMGMIERTFTCPIVFLVMEELKVEFRSRRERW